MVKIVHLLVVALLLSGCAPGPIIEKDTDFTPPAAEGVVYLLPLTTALVPEGFQKLVFDDLVDYLNAHRAEAHISWFFIIKQDLKEVDPAWLASQHYISGELWSYREDSGCCKTALSVYSRVDLFQPGKNEPSIVISIPAETFFDHDDSSLAEQQRLLARRLAHELGTRLIASLSNSP